MDKWIGKFVEKYNEMIFDNLSLDVIRSFHYINFEHLPKGFRRFVTDHLFYYEKIMTTKAIEDSRFNVILVYRSTPFKFNVDFYLDFVFIDVGLLNDQCDHLDFIPMGKYSISDFLPHFVSGIELQENHNVDNQSFDDDQFEVPF